VSEQDDIDREISRGAGRESACGQKIRYGSRLEATPHAYHITQHHDGAKELEPYACYWCGGYHVGGRYLSDER
jgi:hypothetical protein